MNRGVNNIPNPYKYFCIFRPVSVGQLRDQTNFKGDFPENLGFFFY